ncbi:macro domain protein [Oesophagostomum dentatum]|uniref:Macro domain protein n=1 Tax=Oesophagostomum dentatum TaxID=61180 RepID=A0A0B1TM93_OESDE|nr:macro domain protein [Oesophagostomum dentatum]
MECEDKINLSLNEIGVARNILDKISLWRGDITRLEIDAIVNAANNGLAGGGGVDGAIHRAAGTADLQKECRVIGHCDTGAAVITSACKMKHVKNIIHTVGPICHTKVPSVNDRDMLMSCYNSCLDLAVKHNLKTIDDFRTRERERALTSGSSSSDKVMDGSSTGKASTDLSTKMTQSSENAPKEERPKDEYIPVGTPIETVKL